jgi:hypothetical protein
MPIGIRSNVPDTQETVARVLRALQVGDDLSTGHDQLVRFASELVVAPATAHLCSTTASHCNKSGSMNTHKCVL